MIAKLKDSVVVLEPNVALFLLIANIFWAGLGTMLSSCIGKEFEPNALKFGLFQWLLGFMFIGWFWSICHGCWLYKASKG